VLLLIEGVNDMSARGAAGIPRAITALEQMINEATRRRVLVLLATLPPQRPGGQRARTEPLVPTFNAEVRKLAADEGALLVDLFAAFGGEPGTLIGNDGLHPTEAGYQRIAETFFDVIRAHLEAGSTTVDTLSGGGGR
jgi:lysophospholipase L1-like esterase